MGKGRCFHGAGVHLGYMGITRQGCGLYLQVTDSRVCPADAPSQSLSALGSASETSRWGNRKSVQVLKMDAKVCA